MTQYKCIFQKLLMETVSTKIKMNEKNVVVLVSQQQQKLKCQMKEKHQMHVLSVSIGVKV